MSNKNRRSFLSCLSFAPLFALFTCRDRRSSAEGAPDNESYKELISENSQNPKSLKLHMLSAKGSYITDGDAHVSSWIQPGRACFGMFGRLFGRPSYFISACDFAVSVDRDGVALMQIRNADGSLTIIDLQKIAPKLKQLETAE